MTLFALRPRLSELVLVIVSLLYIFVTPYTKVEESFTLHATRDFIEYGLDRRQWHKFDHVEFPGPVTRSFIPPALLAAISYPVIAVGHSLSFWTTGLDVQITVRAILSLVNAFSLIWFMRKVRRAFGPSVARMTIALMATQFHVMFWMSRTLPNMLAFPFVQVALGMLIFPSTQRIRQGKGTSVDIVGAFGLLTFAAVIMRFELIALIVPFALDVIVRGDATMSEVGLTGLVVGGASQALSVAVDSMFWNKTVWPEGSAVLFNVIKGQSTQWGVEPFHFYFTKSLPKLFNFGLPLMFVSMLIDRRTRRVGFPSIMFVGLMSLLKHKEWRFMVYVVPSLNVCVAASLRCLQVLSSKRMKRILLSLIVATNLILTSLGLIASIHNYPGGQAMSFLRNQLSQRHGQNANPVNQTVSVHIDAVAAMTGASRFLHAYEQPLPWFISSTNSSSTVSSQPIQVHYSKIEDLTTFNEFKYLVTRSKTFDQQQWSSLATFESFQIFKLTLKKPFLNVIYNPEESISVLINKDRRST
ncbi:alpha-1,6- mannosyltransferase [Microbotryomycetes sp. JL221]|nr:alpha-1,6- mannosyltransferase [Microbotryomycetes sp. JL221]